MKLVYKTTQLPVEIGDELELDPGINVWVSFFREPHKPSSEGKVSLTRGATDTQEFYVSVIGAEWIEREDRKEG